MKENNKEIDPAEKLMLTEGKAKCDELIPELFSICYEFLKFSEDDLHELEENPIDLLE
jgi:hypothetical protein